MLDTTLPIIVLLCDYNCHGIHKEHTAYQHRWVQTGSLSGQPVPVSEHPHSKRRGFSSDLNEISCILIGAHCLLSSHWTGMQTAREPEMKTAIQELPNTVSCQTRERKDCSNCRYYCIVFFGNVKGKYF